MHQRKKKSLLNNISNVGLHCNCYWHWKRVVALIVLITFSNSIITPVFAKQSTEDKFIASKKSNDAKTNNNSKLTAVLNGPNDYKIKNHKVDNGFTIPINQFENRVFSSSNRFQPYLEVGGAKYFNQFSTAAGIYDLFIPLWQSDNQIFFTDLRIFDRSGGSSEGNLHFGYRKLYPSSNQLFGIYGAFDCRRSKRDNNFRQLTLGFEYWNNNWFIGGNVYKPIGETQKNIGEVSSVEPIYIGRDLYEKKTTIEHYEKVLPGVDAEVGYAINDNLTAYVGGYYFAAKDTDTNAGPKIRLTYEYQKPVGRILGILDGVSIEAGAQHDKQRGNTAYVGIRFKVGLTNFAKNTNLTGFERHMVELVKRDPDIVIGKAAESTSNTTKIYQASDYTQREQDIPQSMLKGLLREFGLPEDATWQDVKNKWLHEYAIKFHSDKHPNATEEERKFLNQQFTHYGDLYEKLKKAFRERSSQDQTFKPQSNSYQSNNSYQSTDQQSDNSKNSSTDWQDHFNFDAKKHESDTEDQDFCPNKNYKPEDLNAVAIVSKNHTESKLNAQERSVEKIPTKTQVQERNNSAIVFVATPKVKIDADVTYKYQRNNISTLQPVTSQNFNQTLAAETKIVATAEINNTTQEQTPGYIDLIFDYLKTVIYTVDNAFSRLLSLPGAMAEECCDKELKSIKVLTGLNKGKNKNVESNGLSSLAGRLSMLGSNKDEVEKDISYLYYKNEELPQSLIEAIFDFYAKDQKHFTDLIVDLLAENRKLPKSILEKLIPALTNIEPKNALFIALRLLQNHVALPIDALKYFIRFLSLKDSSSKIPYGLQDTTHLLALSLYQELNKKTPVEIIPDVTDALIGLYPKVSLEQQSKINDLIDGYDVELNAEQKSRYEMQEEISNWRFTNVFEEKIDISKKLIEQISVKTAKDLLYFFKEHLYSQNTQLLKIAKAAFTELKKYQELSFNKEEQKLLPLLAISDSWLKRLWYANEINIGGENYLLTKEQQQILPEKINDLAGYLKKINFSNFRQIINFLKFIKINKINKNDLQLIIKNNYRYGSNIDIDNFYIELLRNLISNIQVSPRELKILKRTAENLVNYTFWPADLLFSLIKRGWKNDTKNIPKIIKLLKILDNYQIKTTPDTVNRYGITTATILQDKTLTGSLFSIDYLIKDNRYFVAKDIPALLKELADANANNPEILDLIEKNYFTDQLAKVEMYKQGLLKNGVIDKSLPSWVKEDFLQWARTITYIDDTNIAEVAAVLSQAAANTVFSVTRSYPRSAQLLEIFASFKSPKSKFSQIATGEGKSMILPMLAVIYALLHRKVDIVTSKYDLAVRDAENYKSFYDLFGITVSHNIDPNYRGGPRKCYKSDVVYSDTLNIIGDSLRDITQNIKYGRGFDVLFIDEVDYITIDESEKRVQLSNGIPGMENLSPLFVYMWGTTAMVASSLKQEVGQCYFRKPVLDEAQQKKAQDNLDFAAMQETPKYEYVPIPEISNCDDFIKDYITKYTQDTLFAFDHIKEKRLFVIQQHFEKFAQNQLPHWVRSLFTAYSYEKWVDYIVTNGIRENFSIVAPVDRGTGVIQPNLHWGDGVHQFLLLFNNLTLFPESIVSIFLSYSGFLQMYQKRYGVSGTLKPEIYSDFFNSQYDAKLGVIPTFMPRDSIEFRPIIVNNEAQWYEEIIDAIFEISRTRPILVIFNTIAQVMEVKKRLIQLSYQASQIYTYGTGGKDEEDIINRKKFFPNDLILATYFAGRGTDIRLSNDALKNGGLHVIITAIVESARTMEQISGREARKGEPGSLQRIVMITNQDPNISYEEYVEHLNEIPYEKEKQKLERQIIPKISPQNRIQDNLFNAYVQLVREVDSPTGYKLLIADPSLVAETTPFSLYLYKKDTKIMLAIVSENEKEKKYLDVTELIAAIDPQAQSHIKTILFDTGFDGSSVTASNLNKQDYEIIQFIVASNGYTQFPEIYTRVKNAFNKEITAWKETIIKQGAANSFQNTLDRLLNVKEPKNEKSAYLTSLFQNEFRDLLKDSNNNSGIINDDLLQKAELHKLFLLWQEDRNTFNNEYEIQQLNEYWGIWLKQKEDIIFSNNIDLIDQHDAEKSLDIEEEQLRNHYRLEEQLQKSRQIEAQLKEDFAEFRKKILAKRKQKKFIENPTYLVLKAWRYFQIRYTQPEKPISEPIFGTIINDYKKTLEKSDNTIGFSKENYNPTNPLDSAIKFLEEANKLEESWTAYNALSYLHLIRDEAKVHDIKGDEAKQAYAYKVKYNFTEDAYNAIRCIDEKEIPRFEAPLSFLLANQLVDYNDDITKQHLGGMEVFRSIKEALQKNIDTVIKSENDMSIRVNDVLDLEVLTQKVNLTQAFQNLNIKGDQKDVSMVGHKVLNNVTQGIGFESRQLILNQIVASGGHIFEVGTYRIEKEEKQWFGTIFSAVMGIVSICVGFMLPVAGVFMHVLTTSLIAQGISDVISSIISGIRGNPIDAGDYLKSKGINIGITLATAGILSFVNHIAGGLAIFRGIQGGANAAAATHGATSAAANTASTIWNTLGTAAAIQTATIVSGAIIYEVGRKTVDEDEIKKEATNAIDGIIIWCKEWLKKIFTSDAFNKNEEAKNRLYAKISDITYNYQQRFQDGGTQFGVGVATQVAGQLAGGLTGGGTFIGVSNAIETTTQVAMGAIKNTEAIPEIVKDTEKAINEEQSRALKSGDMLELKLSDFTNEHPEDKIQLIAALKSQGYIVNGEVNYNDCDKLTSVQLKAELDHYKPGIVDACKYIGAIFLKDYTGEYEALKNRFVETVSPTIKEIQKHDVVRPFIEGISREVGDRIGNKVVNYIEKQVSETKARKVARKVAEIEKKALESNRDKVELISGKENDKENRLPPRQKRDLEGAKELFSKGGSAKGATSSQRNHQKPPSDEFQGNAFSDFLNKDPKELNEFFESKQGRVRTLFEEVLKSNVAQNLKEHASQFLDIIDSGTRSINPRAAADIIIGTFSGGAAGYLLCEGACTGAGFLVAGPPGGAAAFAGSQSMCSAFGATGAAALGTEAGLGNLHFMKHSGGSEGIKNVGRKVNPSKAESKVWKELKPYKKDIKTNGLKGKKEEFYKWDFRHNDIEVYGPGGNKHLGSKNPITGKIYKPGIPGRNIRREI